MSRFLMMFLMMAGLMVASVAMAIAPVPASPPGFTPIVINNGPGDQNDPHVSGDLAAYTSDLTIRYYRFSTSSDAAIPAVANSRDQLSDISGSKVVFSRMIPGVTAVMVFDADASASVEIDPAPNSLRLGSAIGGNTVAYVDFGLEPNGELVVHDLVDGLSTRLTNDSANEASPSVSPDGNVVTWEHCTAGCEIYQAVKTGTLWAVSTTVGTPASNPDTNGSLVVYDSDRGSGSDIFWKPVSGGLEVQLQIAGHERNPSIAGDYIAFEGGATMNSANDLFVYNIAANLLYQITASAAINEQLNDISVLPDGRIRLVWASDEDGFDQRNVNAATIDFAPRSASYKLEEQAFNAGGNPSQGTVLTSTSYRIRLDAIGDAVGGGALTGPSFHVGGGFIAPYPPPGEVQNVRFSGPTSMEWDHEVSVGSYNIYRGTVGSFADYGTCLQSGLPTEAAGIPESPSPGQAFYFLVTAENTINDEGTKGFASSGAMHPNASPCP